MKKIFKKIKLPKEDLNKDKKEIEKLSKNIIENVEKFKEITHNSAHYIYRDLKLNGKKITLIYIDGFVENRDLNENIINPIQSFKGEDKDKKLKDIIQVGNIQDTNDFNKMVEEILSGKTAILEEGEELVLIADCFCYDKRGVEEPVTESVVRGPREAFTESILTNVTLIRRRIKSPNLVFENFIIGKETKTNVSICYIKGIAKDKIIKEVKDKLNEISADAILESGYIEEYLDQNPLSVFPTISYTEKADVVAGKLLEGRIAIVVDGSPTVLTIPMFFIEAFQTSEDYYIRPLYTLITRNIRLIAFVISILAPSLYVALVTFHQELIPTTLLFTIASSREGLPFPGMFEISIMLIVYEILREAGIRMPKTLGPAISIVGALVLGETAVNAGVVGPAVLIVVALTSVASYVVPTLVDAGIYIRFILLILASVLGMYGIIIGILGLLLHLSSLKSFGVPYLSPIAPVNYNNLKDSFVRLPFILMKRRQTHLVVKNKIKNDYTSSYIKEKFSDNNYQK